MTYLPGLVLMFLALVAWRKQWHTTGVILACVGFLGALSGQEWLQDIIRARALSRLPAEQFNYAMSQRERQQQFLRQTMMEGGRRTPEDLAKKTDGLIQMVSDLQGMLEAQAKRLDAYEQRLSAQQEASQTLEAQVAEARQRIEEHEEQLGGVTSFVHDVSEVAKTVEEFKGREEDRFIVAAARGNREALVYCQLAQVPRLDTLELQWGAYTPAADTYQVHKNIIRLHVVGPVKKLRREALTVRYVPDASRADELAQMSRRKNDILVNGEPVSGLFGQVVETSPQGD